MLSVNQIKDAKQIAAAQELMREYFSWFFTLVPGSESAPTFQGWESEIANLPGIYIPPMGRLLLATINEQPAGCVALKQVTDQIGELKRMYVSPSTRGKRIGWHLGKALLDEAHTIGYKRLVLDSHISMTHAHQIYEELGFKRVEAPSGFPQELIPIVVFMEYDL